MTSKLTSLKGKKILGKDLAYFDGKIKKHGKKISLFFLIGVLKAVLLVFLNWLLIDIVGMWTLLASTIVVAIGVAFTYAAYVDTKVIKPEFMKYISTSIGFNIATIFLIWFFVDLIGFSGAFSSTIVFGGLFAARYFFLNKIGLIYHY